MADSATSENQAADAGAGNPAAAINAPNEESARDVHPAEFPQAAPSRSHAALPLERFSEVQVEISVEIGRVTMSIGELLQLGEGSVVELERDVSEPVSVMAQGVRIARGEVVVIDDRFAVRITEITHTDSGPRPGTNALLGAAS